MGQLYLFLSLGGRSLYC